MRFTHIHRPVLFVLMLLSLCALSGLAQEQPNDNSTPPKPGVRGYLPLINGPNQNDQDAQAPAEAPDQSSLTGAQQFTLGSPEMGHSYWVPGFAFQNSFQSGLNGSPDWISSSYFAGTFSLSRTSRHSQLGLNYSGGGSVTNSDVVSNGYYHGLALAQSFSWNRWQLRFLDQFSYLPQSSYGFGGVGGMSIPGVGGGLGAWVPGLQSNFTGAESIFTATGPRINNSFVTQVDYSLTPRSSLTAAGSYGLLDFIDGNSIDTRSTIFSLGYNYAMTRWDLIGVVYRFAAFRFPGIPQALNGHTVNLAYGRKITGRLALQLSGGPDVIMYRLPIAGESQRTTVSGGASLVYGIERGTITLNYSHGLSGGSGVLVGSTRDQVDARLSSRLARRWDGNLGVGYARNGAFFGGSTGITSPALNSTFASAGISYQVSPTVKFYANYTFDYQDSSRPACPAGTCGANYRQHDVWVGLQWHARPFVIR